MLPLHKVLTYKKIAELKMSMGLKKVGICKKLAANIDTWRYAFKTPSLKWDIVRVSSMCLNHEWPEVSEIAFILRSLWFPRRLDVCNWNKK